MSDSNGDEGRRSTWADVARRSQELAHTHRRLHEDMIDTAESVRRSHERIARTMDLLADNGGEHESRRRRSAETSREFAEDEARQIAALRAGRTGGRTREGAEPTTD